jgi:long-chain acyl-CoA synthetase
MDQRPWHASYDPGVRRELRYEALTLPALLDRAVAAHPDRAAVIFLNGRLTYREFADHVDRFATALAGLGVGKGTRVAIQLINIPQAEIAFFAILRLGGIAVMTNPLYTAREMAHQWADAGCTVAIVMDFIFSQTIAPHRPDFAIRDYVIASIPEYLRFPLNLLAPIRLRRQKPRAMWARVEPGPGIHFFRKLVDGAGPAAPPVATVTMDDVALLQYTGGTTGVSKAATLTHRNMSANVQQLRAWMPAFTEGQEVMLTALPLFHVYGLTVCMNLSVAAAATQVLVPNPRDTKALIHAIAKHRVTMVPAAPAMFNNIVNHPAARRADLSSIKLCKSGSAPLPVDVLHRFEAMTGAKIVEGYGLSETSPVTHCNPCAGTRKPGTIGLPLPDTDVRIVDDAGQPVPPGQAGEIVLRGPQVMAGYWQKPAETAIAIKDGWFYTGDLAQMDAQGYFTIVGRKKDMIDASGFKVYPDEVDRVLMSHAAVLEAATIGVPDVKRGETVKSFVVLKPGATVSAEALVAHCRESLAPYKVPREIEFRTELPKSTVLKILRRQLREEEEAK